MMLAAEQLERLNSVAVQMLDPLVIDAASPAGQAARLQAISDRLYACATVANELQLHGLGRLLGQVAQAPQHDAPTDSWIELAVAFCAGQLQGDAADLLLQSLPALDTPRPHEVIAAQVREDAGRLAHAQQQSFGRQVSPGEIGGDELDMLADACAELDQTVTTWGADQATGLPLVQFAERVGYLANAVRYMGLEPLADLFDHFIGQIQAHADQAQDDTHQAALDESQQQALAQWPGHWALWFRDRQTHDLDAALALHTESSWAAPQLASLARAALIDLQLVNSRRDEPDTAVFATDIDLDDLSLAIPDNTDQEVVDNLLQEFPLLTNEFTTAVAGLAAGKLDRLASALRIAHTIKGVANTVGVVGVANLTHAVEDLLQLCEQEVDQLDATVTETLCDAADCLAEMAESVGGLGAVPGNALSVYREVLSCVNRLVDEQEGSADKPAVTSPGRSLDTRASSPPEHSPFEPSDDAAQFRDDTADDGQMPMPAISLADFDLPDLDLGAPLLDADQGVGKSRESLMSSDEHSGLRLRVPVLGETEEDADWTNWHTSVTDEIAGQPIQPDEPTPSRIANEPDGSAASNDSTDSPDDSDDATSGGMLRVRAGVIDRLLESSDEAVVAVSELQEVVKAVEAAHRAMRVDSDRLDSLSVELDRLIDAGPAAAGLTAGVDNDELDALEMERFTEMHTVSRRITEVAADNKVIEQQIERQLERVQALVDKLDRVQAVVRDGALKARMVEATTIAPRLRRAARQAARVADKEVNFVVQGGDCAVDGETLQKLVDPLAHLVRNAIDHGLESAATRHVSGKDATGNLTVSFERQASGVSIIVEDDGAGLDLVAIEARARGLGLIPDSSPFDTRAAAQLILAPGFTTRANPSQLSGRGIGLDVVNQAVRSLHGVVMVKSEPAVGTRFELSLPLQLSSLSAFVFRADTHVLAVSVRGIEQILSDATTAGIEQNDQGLSIDWQGARLPLRRLDEVLGLPAGMLGDSPGEDTPQSMVLVVKQPAGDPGAVLVPEPGQAREVVVRALPDYLPRIAGIDGVTLLGDGAVAPVVDLPEMLAATAGARPDPRRLGRVGQPMPTCLVVDDSVSVRRAMTHFMHDLGLVCEAAIDGHEALQMISRHIPDIVVIDLEMPRVNGLQLTQALRHDARTEKLPIVMITSRHSEKHRAMAMAAGVTVFMTKPYTEDQLASIVGSCLAG
ncbi:MAG: response regulator [Burkholderiaceae bacterium]